MRFPQLSAMPASSIREWLDHELELRGIDAVIYTRYILSILQQDALNFEPQERDLFPVGSKKSEPCAGKGKGSKSRQKVNTKTKFTDCEERKKSAAVECLLSASEQKCGIEELVDELCSRLKSIQCEGYAAGQDTNTHDVKGGPTRINEANLIQASPEELAKKYYAAFPALNGKLQPRDETATLPNYNMQFNTFWDGKKLLLTTNDSELKNDNANCSASSMKAMIDKGETVTTFSFETKSTTVAETDRRSVIAATKARSAKHASKLDHIHHTHHRHHQHFYAKSTKCGRDQGGGKPSFIVPKCKYRMLKQRVPSLKGKSPFSAPELKLKRFVINDSKLNCKSPNNRCNYSKKFDDIEVGYDSSFEDGDVEEATAQPDANAVVEEATAQPNVNAIFRRQEKMFECVFEPDGKYSSEKPSNPITLYGEGECDQFHDVDKDDVSVLHKLEAKFDKSLASIWSAQDSGDVHIDKLSQMLETAFKSLLSTCITNLNRSSDNFVVDVYTPSEMVAAMDYYIGITEGGRTDGVLDDYPRYPGEEQVSIKNFPGLGMPAHGYTVSEDAGPPYKEPLNRIWKCETEKHNFIKGGVYGFEKADKAEDGKLSQDDLLEIGKDALASNSPAFDSDAESFAEECGGSGLERNAIREEELRIIWEVLGAIGSCDESECGEIPSFLRKTPEAETECKSVTQQMHCFDLWDEERSPLKGSWNYGSDYSSRMSELAILWNGSFDKRAKEEILIGTDNGSTNSFCWGSAESYHKSFWDIWKDSMKNGNTGGSNAIESLVAGSLNPEDHLNMTRSYDSYLNKEVVEDAYDNGLAQTVDMLHRSDPLLFDRKSTLTWHKGESVFVEVKPRHRSSPPIPEINYRDDIHLSNSSCAANAVFSNDAEIRHSNNEANDGVALPRDEDEDGFEEENLLTSPKTHFRPIRPMSCDSDACSVSSCELAVEDMDEALQTNKMGEELQGGAAAAAKSEVCADFCAVVTPPDEKPPIFTQDENGILHLSSDNEDGKQSCHLYMLYRGHEGSRRQLKETVSSFVPKFKLRPDMEKFCQTEEVGMADVSRAGKCRSSERSPTGKEGLEQLQRKITSAFADSMEKSGRGIAGVNYSLSALGRDIGCTLGQGSGHSFSVDKYGKEISGSLWSVGDDCDDLHWPAKIKYGGISNLDERDFWAISEREENEESEEMMSMKEEIKQEEEELFEDINQMRELDLHNEWNEDEGYSPGGMHNIGSGKQGNTLEWPSREDLYQEAMLECQDDEDCPELEMINGKQCETPPSWSQNVDDDGCTQESEAADERASVNVDFEEFETQNALNSTTGNHPFEMIPTNKLVYSSDLEEEWMKHEKPFDIQVPKRHFLKAKLRSQRRPCTFYMDGNCKRTDCKFSHDLASITCRFWEEGTCFKGITCPFLHGYPRKHSPLHSGKAKDFHLESESDFPSLSKSADSTSSGGWMASAFSAKRKRKRNRPRHHSSSIMEADSAKSKLLDSNKA